MPWNATLYENLIQGHSVQCWNCHSDRDSLLPRGWTYSSGLWDLLLLGSVLHKALLSVGFWGLLEFTSLTPPAPLGCHLLPLICIFRKISESTVNCDLRRSTPHGRVQTNVQIPFNPDVPLYSVTLLLTLLKVTSRSGDEWSSAVYTETQTQVDSHK